jgi:PAS domain S-box-containing protein
MRVVSQFGRYALATISCGLALAVAWPLDAPSSCFFLAVTVSSLYGGKGPGLLSVGLSALAFDYFFVPQKFSFSIQPDQYFRFAIFVGAAFLITALVEAKRRVEKSRDEINAQYRTIADTAPDAIISIDSDARILLVNPAATRIFGWDAPEMIGQPLTILLPKFQLAEGLSGGELIGRRNDGTEFSAEVSFGAVSSGDQSTFTGFVRDISDCKVEEAALQKSESYLAEAQRLGHAGSWALYVDRPEMIYWSAEMFRIFGLPPADHPPSQEEIRRFFAPEVWAQMLEMAKTARRKKIDFDDEFPLIFRDGSNRMLRVVGHPVLDIAGNVVELVGTTMDVTEQHQARAALQKAFEEIKESEDRLRVIINTIPTQVWSTRPDGFAEFFNQRWLEYTGLSVEQALDRGWTAAIHPDDVNRLVGYWQSILASGEPGEIEARLRRFDGEYRWFLFRASPLRDESGQVVKWYGTNTDIEDRRRAEEAVRERERDLGLTIETIPALVWCAAPDGHVTYVNRRILNYTGESIGALAQSGWINFVHPDDVDPTLRVWSHMVATGQGGECQYRFRRSDGVYRWFHVRGQPARDSEGHVTRWYGVLIDIDDRKSMEEALRSTQMRLSRAAQIATVGELAGSIAHEINQPLAALVANGHASLRWLSAQPPNVAKAREAAERILRDGNDAAEVVRRIRALFRPAALEKVALDLTEVIGEVLRLLGGETAKRRVAVETYFEKDLAPVVGDRVQLQQLVLNLLRNGLEAMDSVLDRPKKISILSKRHSPETVRVEIRDYGVGLEDPNRVFEAFFTTKENGMGMGLAICRSIVEAHDGRLWAASGEGPGTTFCFTLPVKATAAA